MVLLYQNAFLSKPPSNIIYQRGEGFLETLWGLTDSPQNQTLATAIYLYGHY